MQSPYSDASFQDGDSATDLGQRRIRSCKRSDLSVVGCLLAAWFGGCHRCSTSEVELSTTSASAPLLAPSDPAQTLTRAAINDLLVDDLEDGDTAVRRVDGRNGTWYIFKDTDGSWFRSEVAFVQQPTASNASGYAVHVSGETAPVSGAHAGVGLYFTSPRTPYDLSSVDGFCFSATGEGLVSITLPDINTHPEGGICKACFNSFGRRVLLGDEWQTYCLGFDDLTQRPGWGEPLEALASTRVFAIQFEVNGANVRFDVWVDDVRLTRRRQASSQRDGGVLPRAASTPTSK